jgi:Na+/melibiose symporter-like transporter
VSLRVPVLLEIRMSDWKVLFIAVFGAICLALVIATIVVPLALDANDNKWLWFGGLLLATISMGTLFTIFLRRSDRTFVRDSARRDR